MSRVVNRRREYLRQPVGRNPVREALDGVLRAMPFGAAGKAMAGAGAGAAIPDSAIAQYDARDLSLSEGESVSTWPDNSANGYDLSGTGPVYRDSDINGNPAVEFDGTDDILTISFPSNVPQPLTIISVTKTDIVDGGGNLRGVVGAETNRSWYSEPAGGNNYNIDAGSSGVQGGTPNSNPTLLTAIFDLTTKLREDGTEIISDSLGTADWDGLSVGHDPIDVGGYYDGSMGFIEVHDTALSGSDLSDREQSIADEWGITL